MTGPAAGPLAGQAAIVTGGATGIGFHIAARLLADGARLMLAGLTSADVDAALAAFGQVDVLVNNAGGGVIAPTLAHTEETMQATIGPSTSSRRPTPAPASWMRPGPGVTRRNGWSRCWPTPSP